MARKMCANQQRCLVCCDDRQRWLHRGGFEAFDGLEYENKVVFTCREYGNIPSAFCIHGFEKKESVGHLHSVMSITGKRYIDQFDYVEFLNRGF